jgi:hypothetical protein
MSKHREPVSRWAETRKAGESPYTLQLHASTPQCAASGWEAWHPHNADTTTTAPEQPYCLHASLIIAYTSGVIHICTPFFVCEVVLIRSTILLVVRGGGSGRHRSLFSKIGLKHRYQKVFTNEATRHLPPHTHTHTQHSFS